MGLSTARSGRIFFVADLRLDDAEALKSCRRHFETVPQMNSALVTLWNQMVDPDDIVNVIGQLASGRGERTESHWHERLNGLIIPIEGDHTEVSFRAPVSMEITEMPPKFREEAWTIHGGQSGAESEAEGLFFDRHNKAINVSAELIGLRPVQLEMLQCLVARRDVKIVSTITDIPAQYEEYNNAKKTLAQRNAASRSGRH